MLGTLSTLIALAVLSVPRSVPSAQSIRELRIANAAHLPPNTKALVTYVGNEDDFYITDIPVGGVIRLKRPGAALITVATGAEFGTSRLEGDAGGTLTTSRECHRIQFRVVTPTGKAAPVVVRLARWRGDPQEAYVVRTASDGGVTTCLPADNYSLDVFDKGFYSFTSSIHIEGPSVFPTITALPRSANRTRGLTPTLVRASRVSPSQGLSNPLTRDASIIAIGEPNHGSANANSFRMTLVKQLPATSGALVLLEGGVGDALLAEKFIQGQHDDLGKAVDHLRFWMWNTLEFEQTLRELRALNATRPDASRIHIAGIDMQSPVHAYEALAEDLLPGTPAGDILRRLAFLIAPSPAKHISTISANEHMRLVDDLRRLRVCVASNGLHTLLVDNLLQYVAFVDAGHLRARFTLRDQFMAENATALIRGHSGLTFIWAHNSHVSKERYQSLDTLGGHLWKRFGTKYVAVAVLTGEGTFLAWDRRGDVGVHQQVLPSLAPDMLERSFKAAGVTSDLLSLSSVSPLGRFLRQQPVLVREFGAAWTGEHDSKMLRNIAYAFDALYFELKATATTLNANAAKKFGPNRAK